MAESEVGQLTGPAVRGERLTRCPSMSVIRRCAPVWDVLRSSRSLISVIHAPGRTTPSVTIARRLVPGDLASIRLAEHVEVGNVRRKVRSGGNPPRSRSVIE